MNRNYDADYVYTGHYKAGNHNGNIVIRPCGIEIEKDFKVHLFTWNDGNNPDKLKSLISKLNSGLPVVLELTKGSRYIDIMLGSA